MARATIEHNGESVSIELHKAPYDDSHELGARYNLWFGDDRMITNASSLQYVFFRASQLLGINESQLHNALLSKGLHNDQGSVYSI